VVGNVEGEQLGGGPGAATEVIERALRSASLREGRAPSLTPRSRADRPVGRDQRRIGTISVGAPLEADRVREHSVGRDDLSMQVLGYLIAIIAFAAAGLLSLLR
jgi:hypothetical protein